MGGIGRSGIAQILLDMGYEVSVSDIKENKNIERLRKMGAKVFIGLKEENVLCAQVLVYSSAVSVDNPEVRKAKELGDIKEAFLKFANAVPFYGFVVLNMDEKLREIADGRVFTGRVAKDLGHEDELGNLPDAINRSS